MYNLNEIEHQELFYLAVDAARPVAVHIPSALGKLGYFLFVRVPADQAAQLAGVSTHCVVGGLRLDDVTIAPGEGAEGISTIPSKVEGFVWYCLGRAFLSRGDGTLTFHDWPCEIPKADLLLCTWPRFVENGQADDWIAGQRDPHWAPSGVPLGGIGGGRIDICRDGRFRNFSMNHNQDAPLENPEGISGAYLGVTCDGVTKDMATRPIMPGHEACAELSYQPRFPQAMLTAPQLFAGIDVTVTLSGTLCPHDLRRSSIPGFLVRWQVTNTASTDAQVRCQMGWPNLIGAGGGIASAETSIGRGDGGYHQCDDPTGRVEEALSAENYSGVRYTGSPAESLRSFNGVHYLAVAVQDGIVTGSHCGDGLGEVFADVTVPAGQTVELTMAMVASMPVALDRTGIDRGHFWQDYFADGEGLVSTLIAEADEILREAGALSALLDDSTLPAWLRSRLCNCTYPLVTNSVFYRDGRFSINEGPTEMAGCYGTIDQRLASHPATQLLFPQLNATELTLFGNIQGEHGGIRHDLGHGTLECPPGEMPWPDVPCSFVIQTARHAWSTGDIAFENQMWPRARRALLRHAEWAQAGDGVAQVGKSLGTSYDGYHYFGTTGYMATLWLAALAVGEKWARKCNDSELLVQIPQWRAAAIQRLEEDLWNGRYYIAYNDRAGMRRETSHAGQLAGQVFAQLLAGEDVLGEDRLFAVIDTLLAMNGSERFAVPPDEVDEGEEVAPFGWLPYVEGFMLTAIAAKGDTRVLPLWERMMACVEADGKTPCDTRLMYRPTTGEPSWGAYYMTAPASWLVYDALLDFFYTPAEATLRLRTTIPGRYPLAHPLFWGTAEITENGDVTLTITRTFSEQPLYISSFEVPTESAGIQCDGQALAKAGECGKYTRYQLPKSVALQPGVTLSWQVAAMAQVS